MRAKLAGALSLVILASLLAGVAVADDRAAAITEIRQESNAHSTRLVVACTGPVAYTYYSPDPLTLVVDIPEVDPSKVPSRISVGTSEVESVRVTSMVRADGRSLARVEVRLASLVPYQIFSKDTTLHLVFDRGAEAASASAPATRTAAAEPGPGAAGRGHGGGAAEPPARRDGLRTSPGPPSPRSSSRPASARPRASAGIDGGRPRATVTRPRASSPSARPTTTAASASTSRPTARSSTRTSSSGNPDRLVIDFKDVMSRVQRPDPRGQQGPGAEGAPGPVQRGLAPRGAPGARPLRARALPHRRRRRRRQDRVRRGRRCRRRRRWPRSSRRRTRPRLPAGEMMEAAMPVQLLPGPAPRRRRCCPTPRARRPLRNGPAEFEPVTLNPGDQRFTGHPISLDFKDGDLQDIFRLFADISGLNIVVNPGVSRQGDAEAQRGALGPGPRPHPEGERARLHARGQRHPHRAPRRPAERGAAAPQAGGGARPGRRPGQPHHAHLLRQGAGAGGRAAQGGRPLRARQPQRRPPHEHPDHQRPSRVPGEGQGADRHPRPADAPGGDRGAHRGHEPELHA